MNWEGSGGILVWGSYFKGSNPIPQAEGPLVLDESSSLSTWNDGNGTGNRLDANGGSFPAGDFEWSFI